MAFGRTSKLVFIRIYRKATKLATAAFLRVMIKTGPYRTHTIPTDKGVQFVQRDQGGVQGWIGHIFGRVCKQNGIERRLTKPHHPWTKGQAKRMVRTIKEATVKSFHYISIDELRRRVRDWLLAYNFATQLRFLRIRTPYEAVEQLWKANPIC